MSDWGFGIWVCSEMVSSWFASLASILSLFEGVPPSAKCIRKRFQHFPQIWQVPWPRSLTSLLLEFRFPRSTTASPSVRTFSCHQGPTIAICFDACRSSASGGTMSLSSALQTEDELKPSLASVGRDTSAWNPDCVSLRFFIPAASIQVPLTLTNPGLRTAEGGEVCFELQAELHQPRRASGE